MSSSLKNLESRGLIERIQSADNKKHIEIVLLNKAYRIIEDGIKAQKEFAKIALDGLTVEEAKKKIIAWLEKHPGGESQIRRFVSYYMPTTLKLLRTYNEVDPQADSSAVAAEIQTDICGILYTINTAFQSLQDNLLKDTAMDVSAEISALETVLAQEGLTKDELLGR